MNIKLHFIVIAESRTREDVYRSRKPLQDEEVNKLTKALGAQFELEINSGGDVRSKREGVRAAGEANRSDCAAVLLYVPTFTNPATVVHTARLLQKPVAVAGNHSPQSFSQVGFLASVGAMDQVGIRHKRIVHDASTEAAMRELLNWARAAGAMQRLRGQVYGSIGGRSLGISTGTADLVQWEREFGVDIEHIDQYEIVRRAEQIPAEEIASYREYVKKTYGGVMLNAEQRFSEQHLDRMIASYLATRQIIDAYELDFCGIKCQPEMSNGFCLQCLSVQTLNDPYDGFGGKEPFVCSCETDADGALSMQILKLISGGRPTALQDIYYMSGEEMIFANCGSMASHFASLSDDPAENLGEVHLVPHSFGEAGGASTQFVCASGRFTYMRLFRHGGAYHMAVFRGEVEKKPREVLKDYAWSRPTSFVRHRVNLEEFMSTYSSNHVHCVQGDYVDALEEFCALMGIPCKVYREGDA